jgi:hypothetical protein
MRGLCQVAEDIVRVFEGALGSMRSGTAAQQQTAKQQKRSRTRDESEEDDADVTVST